MRTILNNKRILVSSDSTPTQPNSTLTSYQMQRPRTNLKTQSIQSSGRHTCSGHNAQTNDYFTTGTL